jgi:DNA-binding NarL/FixJ family response regulator
MDPTSKTGELRKSRIFLIDDHPLVREGLVNLINSQRDLVVCGEAEDSAGAITGIAKTRPDIALVDISLKNESGLELVKNLESQFPLVALIVLSMHDEALYAERALRAGARGYVMKRESSKASSHRFAECWRVAFMSAKGALTAWLADLAHRQKRLRVLRLNA